MYNKILIFFYNYSQLQEIIIKRLMKANKDVGANFFRDEKQKTTQMSLFMFLTFM